MDYCQYSTQGLEAYDYLVRHSGRKLNEFCLSYIFTKNDFQDGSLGLAWTASSQRGKLSTPSIKVNNDGPKMQKFGYKPMEYVMYIFLQLTMAVFVLNLPVSKEAPLQT